MQTSWLNHYSCSVSPALRRCYRNPNKPCQYSDWDIYANCWLGPLYHSFCVSSGYYSFLMPLSGVGGRGIGGRICIFCLTWQLNVEVVEYQMIVYVYPAVCHEKIDPTAVFRIKGHGELTRSSNGQNFNFDPFRKNVSGRAREIPRIFACPCEIVEKWKWQYRGRYI